MRLTCAGKVFIAGEYTCIEGGPALLGTVGPEFSLSIVKDTSQHEHALPFHAQSPAGLYLGAHREALREVRLEWLDPYTTPIGVGSSSAQFLLSVAAVSQLKGKALPEADEVLRLYWKTVGETQGLRPSGVDVVAQWLGGPLLARNHPFDAQKLAPWSGSGNFILAFTGSKARTHEHLSALREKGFPKTYQSTLVRLNEITLRAVEAWEAQDARTLGGALNEFQSELTKGGLAPREFSARIEELQTWSGVLGCKGSGAQGGDCVLLLTEPSAHETVCAQIESLGWQPTSVNWASDGLRLR